MWRTKCLDLLIIAYYFKLGLDNFFCSTCFEQKKPTRIWEEHEELTDTDTEQ